MRIAIVSDIHGNRTAFEAVLADLRQTSPDLILHGGDLADGGASPAEIVDQIRELIEELQEAGFTTSEISVLLPDSEGRHDIGHVKATKAPEGATTGATAGGVTGGVLGLLAGIGALAIPGIGPFIAAGPLMAALSVARQSAQARAAW